MPVLQIFAGPTKRDIIKRAFGICGQSTYEFDLQPEEYNTGLTVLNNIMAMLLDQRGVDLGYNFPAYGAGLPDDQSGIPNGTVTAVSYMLAHDLAPEIGKTLSAEANRTYASSMSMLLSKYGTSTPTMQMGRGTIRGAGNRWRRTFGPYFVTTVSDSEQVQ